MNSGPPFLQRTLVAIASTLRTGAPLKYQGSLVARPRLLTLHLGRERELRGPHFPAYYPEPDQNGLGGPALAPPNPPRARALPWTVE